MIAADNNCGRWILSGFPPTIPVELFGAIDNEADTVLMIAARVGDNNLLQNLIQRKVDVNWKNNAGKTALIEAVLNGRYDAVQELINAGADTSVTLTEVSTPVHLAKRAGFEEIANLLEEHSVENA